MAGIESEVIKATLLYYFSALCPILTFFFDAPVVMTVQHLLRVMLGQFIEISWLTAWFRWLCKGQDDHLDHRNVTYCVMSLNQVLRLKPAPRQHATSLFGLSFHPTLAGSSDNLVQQHCPSSCNCSLVYIMRMLASKGERAIP